MNEGIRLSASLRQYTRGFPAVLACFLKEAAMYLYPFEDPGPATKETLLDLWGRWAAWLDVHLKNPELVFE